MKLNIKSHIIPALCVLLISVFPIVFLYGNNAGEASIRDALRPLLILTASGIALYLLFFFCVKNPAKASLIASAAMLIFSNFAFLEKGIKWIAPSTRYWHAAAVAIVLVIYAAYFVVLYLSDSLSKDISKVVCLVFAILGIMNIAMGIPKLITKMNEEEVPPAQILEEQATASDDMPNIYWYIFDEYAGFRQLQEYYDFDNKELSDFLIENHFNISHDSHNESIMTSTILTNVACLDYVVDNTWSEAEKEKERQNGKLFTLLREHGYEIDIAEQIAFFRKEPFEGQGSGGSGAMTASGENLEQLCMQNTILHPLFRLNTSAEMDKVNKLVSYLSDSEKIPQKPTFRIGYLNMPHAPFIVDKMGRPINATQYYNWKDDQYYLEQLQYTTKLLKQMVQNVLDNDPDSIIIVQSDHGARASTDMELFMEKFPLEIMNNPMQAVYYRGKVITDFSNLSSVNNMRAVLENLWGEPMTEVSVPADTYQYK